MAATSGENSDLNLPLSRLHLERQLHSPVSASHYKRLNSLAFTPPPPSNPTTQHSCAPPSKSQINPSKEFGSVDANVSGGACLRIPKQEEAENNSLPGYKAKTRRAKNVTKKEPKSEPVENLNLTGCCRYDSSLGLLTKKFIKLFKESKDGILDLNRTAYMLMVQKRRIYDITNVLEGIGLIEKSTKSHICWKGPGIFEPKPLEDEFSQLKEEMESLYAQENRLDNEIREKLDRIRELQSDKNCQKNLFLREEDITSLPCLRNQTAMIIRAPRASFIEVPDPDEEIGFSQKQYRLIVRSTTGPIDVYLLSKNEKKSNDIPAKWAKLLDPLTWGSSRMMIDDTDLSSSCCDTSTSSEVSRIHKIIPSNGDIDDDYWLKSDYDMSALGLWGVEDR